MLISVATGHFLKTDISIAVVRTMKFTGLILICATSSLALILPAIGVVHFPKTQATPLAPVPGFLTNAPSNPSQLAWNPTSPGSDLLSNARAMPGTAAPYPSMPMAPYNSNAALIPGAKISDAKIPNANGQPMQSANNKLGVGIWLMLGPVCLLGLVMWTFGSNPSGAKPR